MNCTITIDWKFAAALGATVVATIFVVKMDSAAVERVSIHAIDSCLGNVVTGNGNH